VSEFIYNSEGKYSVAWVCYHLEIDEKDGSWYNGCKTVGGRCMGVSGGINYHTPFKSREESIADGIERLMENANLSLSKETDVNNTKEYKRVAQDFIDWVNGRQLTMF
jgi:hypothetical protein